MELGKIAKEMFRPTVPKIALYAAMAFIVPASLKICAETCTSRIVPLAGYRLVLNPELYVFTFPRMIFMFINAYIAASIAILLVNAARERGKWRKPKV
ncbi:MAG: hypothetical protein QME12_05560 [Nanoarchaeota archaeon]|nr:hypothetical protein [Nanoarchaeota archaeon]